MAVNVTEHINVVALKLARVHGLPMNDPVAVPVLVNATVPAGALAVPVADVSLTNAVQLVACPTTMVDGEHATVVEVVRSVTARVVLPELPL